MVRERLPCKRHGFSLIEAAIVLGIIGLVIGGIWVAAARVLENQKLSRMKEELLVVTSNIRKLYAHQPLPSSMPDTIPSLAANAALWPSLFPPDMVVGTTKIVTPWQTDLYVNVSTAWGGTIYFGIVAPSVRVCSALGPPLYAALRNQPGLTMVTGTNVQDISTPALAAANCQQEYDDWGDIIIAVTFKF